MYTTLSILLVLNSHSTIATERRGQPLPDSADAVADNYGGGIPAPLKSTHSQHSDAHMHTRTHMHAHVQVHAHIYAYTRMHRMITRENKGLTHTHTHEHTKACMLFTIGT